MLCLPILLTFGFVMLGLLAMVGAVTLEQVWAAILRMVATMVLLAVAFWILKLSFVAMLAPLQQVLRGSVIVCVVLLATLGIFGVISIFKHRSHQSTKGEL